MMYYYDDDEMIQSPPNTEVGDTRTEVEEE